ncbi:hypothetical protein GCM10010528_03440 [Gordonia defluvii]|jgi:hypothetical protein|uniref:Glycerophosphoryl diester phosphodiesterase membrane domain-containing protein n=1 Tax=Gordonia defluvii TaxID=283718 RepID=A0ABN3YBM2_9ACTN|nr:hypothetical protein [Gordonia sp. UBA5067]
MSAGDDPLGGERTRFVGWTPPNVEVATPQPGLVDAEWQPAGPRTGRGAQLPTLPGVELPTRLPEPQPAPVDGLVAHKPGSAPLRPLTGLDIVSGAVSVASGNLGIIGLLWVCAWVPAAAIVVVARVVDPGLGLVALSIAAFVMPVALTGALASPLHATAIGRPMAFADALSAAFARLVPRTALEVAGLAILAAPALLLGLVLAAITEVVAKSVAVLLLPVLYTAPLSVYLLVAVPIQLIHTVLAVEGAPLEQSVRRGLYLSGKSLLHHLVPIALQAILFSTIGFAILMSVGLFFLRGMPAMVMLIAGAVLSPIAAGFAVMYYVDARIRQEGYDVELSARVASGAGAEAA